MPAYFTDLADWLDLCADPTVAEVVANVDSGPGDSLSPQWRNVLEMAAEAGIRIAGYVATGAGPLDARMYGAKPVEQILEESARWNRFYGSLIKDRWFDEIPPSGGRLRWLRQLNHAARFAPNGARTGGRALFNPGAGNVSRATMLALPDSLWCRWEGPGWLYLAERPRAIFLRPRTLHLVHTVAATDLQAVERHALRYSGLSYVTGDGPDGNPWNSFRRQAAA